MVPYTMHVCTPTAWRSLADALARQRSTSSSTAHRIASIRRACTVPKGTHVYMWAAACGVQKVSHSEARGAQIVLKAQSHRAARPELRAGYNRALPPCYVTHVASGSPRKSCLGRPGPGQCRVFERQSAR